MPIYKSKDVFIAQRNDSNTAFVETALVAQPNSFLVFDATSSLTTTYASVLAAETADFALLAGEAIHATTASYAHTSSRSLISDHSNTASLALSAVYNMNQTTELKNTTFDISGSITETYASGIVVTTYLTGNYVIEKTSAPVNTTKVSAFYDTGINEYWAWYSIQLYDSTLAHSIVIYVTDGQLVSDSDLSLYPISATGVEIEFYDPVLLQNMYMSVDNGSIVISATSLGTGNIVDVSNTVLLLGDMTTTNWYILSVENGTAVLTSI